MCLSQKIQRHLPHHAAYYLRITNGINRTFIVSNIVLNLIPPAPLFLSIHSILLEAFPKIYLCHQDVAV